jgi:hypothetical protein
MYGIHSGGKDMHVPAERSITQSITQLYSGEYTLTAGGSQSSADIRCHAHTGAPIWIIINRQRQQQLPHLWMTPLTQLLLWTHWESATDQAIVATSNNAQEDNNKPNSYIMRCASHDSWHAMQGLALQ